MSRAVPATPELLGLVADAAEEVTVRFASGFGVTGTVHRPPADTPDYWRITDRVWDETLIYAFRPEEVRIARATDEEAPA